MRSRNWAAQRGNRNMSQPTELPKWRVIASPPADGGWNMAVDEAMLEAVRSGEVPPTLRFYTWQPWCLSIGYFQRAGRSSNPQALLDRGYGLVRRPTGGRGILHANELTYSIAAPIAAVGGCGTSVVDTYLAISKGIAAGLRSLGVPVEIAPRDAGRVRVNRRAEAGTPAAPSSAACFDAASACELTAFGRKIVGSAQTRRGGTLLQHGSIPITVDFSTTCEVMGMPSEAAEDLAKRMATIGEFLPSIESAGDAGLATLRQAVLTGLTDELMKEARPGELTQAELDTANGLADKYRSHDWTYLR